MKIRFTLPTTEANWQEESAGDSCHYSRSWTLRVGAASSFGKLIGWADLYKPDHIPMNRTFTPYHWSMEALLERDEPAGWVATLEEAQAEILKRLGTVEAL